MNTGETKGLDSRRLPPRLAWMMEEDDTVPPDRRAPVFQILDVTTGARARSSVGELPRTTLESFEETAANRTEEGPREERERD